MTTDTMAKYEYVFDRTLTKSPCIYKQVGCVISPVMYLKKAKHATDEDFERIIEHIKSEPK